MLFLSPLNQTWQTEACRRETILSFKIHVKYWNVVPLTRKTRTTLPPYQDYSGSVTGLARLCHCPGKSLSKIIPLNILREWKVSKFGATIPLIMSRENWTDVPSMGVCRMGVCVWCPPKFILIKFMTQIWLWSTDALAKQLCVLHYKYSS